MRKQLFIVMLICLRGADYMSAQQWTKKDSVWLQNVLSGKEKLELNPETMKAIQSGSLINLDEPASEMKMAPVTPLPILKDFTEYIQTDSTNRKKSPQGPASRCFLVILSASRKDVAGLQKYAQSLEERPDESFS